MLPTPSFAFGLLMVAAGTVQADGPALIFAAVALAALVVALTSPAAATVAVVATALALALSHPSAVIAAVGGLAATLYLVLRHARSEVGFASLTGPTVLGALGLSAVAVLGTVAVPTLPWLPLAAPLAIVVIYLLVVGQYTG